MGALAGTEPAAGRVVTATTGSRPAIAAGGGRDVSDTIIGAVIVLAILALLFLAYRRLRGR
jgi:hypothetical protein